jgi:endonuclease/exonuclease/phosphatase family metal-dependent hydrolase
MASDTEFVVMTINAGGGRRARKKPLNPTQIADDLGKLISSTIGRPDVIAVQESHQVWKQRESPPEETSQKLAQKLGESGESYRGYFSEYLDSDSHAHCNKWKADGPFTGFKRVKQGNAVITNKDLSEWPWGLPDAGCPGYEKRAPISTQISGATLYSTGNRNTEPRNLIVVPLSLGQGVSLYFMATHLTTLTGEDRHDHRKPRSKEASDVRLAQVHEILQVVEELKKAERDEGLPSAPIILAGDFNARPCSPELDTLEQTFLRLTPRWYDEKGPFHRFLAAVWRVFRRKTSKKTPWTHVRHETHVDHIFYNDPDGLLTPIDCFVLTQSQVGKVTDHLPVVAKFEIKQIP